MNKWSKSKIRKISIKNRSFKFSLKKKKNFIKNIKKSEIVEYIFLNIFKLKIQFRIKI